MLKKAGVCSVLFSFAVLSSSAYAQDFSSACMEGAPDGVSEAQASAYCACLDDATAGDDGVRAELEASWPTGDIQTWVASLSADAAAAASSCQP